MSLAAKAILIAKIWKERTGEGQDIHVDVRKALRPKTPGEYQHPLTPLGSWQPSWL